METLSNAEPTILYVDDQPSHRLLFERTFRGQWLVLTVSTAEEGLKILQEHDVFLVVADHNMPGITGIDFLEKVKAVAPHSVRAILSAYSDEALKEEAKRRAGISAYLEKPWDRKKIRAFIEESFLQFLHGTSTLQPEQKDYESILRERNIPLDRLMEMADQLEKRVDDRAARRIVLTFSEPPLKSYLPLIRRPAPASLVNASYAAICGQMGEVEKALWNYLREPREPAPPPEPIRH